MTLNFTTGRLLSTSPVLEYVGDAGLVPGMLDLFEKYGLQVRAVAPEAAESATLTLCFWDGNQDFLSPLLKRKNNESIVVVGREALPQFSSKGISCFTATGPEDAYEIARCIYVKYYQLKAERPTASAAMMRQVFRYAMRILS